MDLNLGVEEEGKEGEEGAVREEHIEGLERRA